MNSYNTNWWWDDPSEIFWCEITDRDDIGADLKCPQTNDKGQPYWSYNLINQIWPGEIVFHYSTKPGLKAFVGASVAGGPVEDRPIVWTAHGTVGRSKPASSEARPGWWLPLHGYEAATPPLRRSDLLIELEQEWIRNWIEMKEQSTGQSAKAPFQLYPREIRASQGYLTKMPKEFVNRWPGLTLLADRLSPEQEKLISLGETAPPRQAVGVFDPLENGLRLKDDSPYYAEVHASVQRRSRNHERLIRDAVDWLSALGAVVKTPHPIDLFVASPIKVILEGELGANRGPRAAIREALGQLHDYRYFYGQNDSALCILLDVDPGASLVEYVETYLDLFIIWRSDHGFESGPMTQAKFIDVLESNLRVA
jgi:hypothetical protein